MVPMAQWVGKQGSEELGTVSNPRFHLLFFHFMNRRSNYEDCLYFFTIKSTISAGFIYSKSISSENDRTEFFDEGHKQQIPTCRMFFVIERFGLKRLALEARINHAKKLDK